MNKYLLLPATLLFLLLTCCTKSDGQEQEEENNGTKPPFEIWMGQKAGSTGNWSNLEWKIVLPDGSYFNQLPREGFLNFSKNQTGGSWGIFSVSGNSGTFQNQYESIQVKKISSTELEKIGYSNRLYLLSTVDGLKLNGSYNTIPNWSTISNYPYGPADAQPMISFDQQGNFLDQGAFVTNFTQPYQDAQRAPGAGTYEIKKFTLILNYTDGRKITRSFSGVLNNKVSANSELVLIAGNPFYNK